MDAHFTGSRLFIFGVRGEPGDVVVIVRGPMKNYIVRKKENFAGLWINYGRMKLYGVPAFYTVSASKPLYELGSPEILRPLGIGEYQVMPAHGGRFTDAFLEYKRAEQHYATSADTFGFVGDALFKTAVDFPDTTPPGQYAAEIYLLRDGKVAGMQTLPIEVTKVGLDAWIYRMAHEWPALYGLSAIALAALVGWLAGKAFFRA